MAVMLVATHFTSNYHNTNDSLTTQNHSHPQTYNTHLNSDSHIHCKFTSGFFDPLFISTYKYIFGYLISYSIIIVMHSPLHVVHTSPPSLHIDHYVIALHLNSFLISQTII